MQQVTYTSSCGRYFFLLTPTHAFMLDLLEGKCCYEGNIKYFAAVCNTELLRRLEK